MSSVKMDSERYEAELTQNWLHGKKCGIEEVMGFLNGEAGKAFAERRDDRARAYREAADLVRTQMLPSYEKGVTKHHEDFLKGQPDIEEIE